MIFVFFFSQSHVVTDASLNHYILPHLIFFVTFVSFVSFTLSSHQMKLEDY